MYITDKETGSHQYLVHHDGVARPNTDDELAAQIVGLYSVMKGAKRQRVKSEHHVFLFENTDDGIEITCDNHDILLVPWQDADYWLREYINTAWGENVSVLGAVWKSDFLCILYRSIPLLAYGLAATAILAAITAVSLIFKLLEMLYFLLVGH